MQTLLRQLMEGVVVLSPLIIIGFIFGVKSSLKSALIIFFAILLTAGLLLFPLTLIIIPIAPLLLPPLLAGFFMGKKFNEEFPKIEVNEFSHEIKSWNTAKPNHHRNDE